MEETPAVDIVSNYMFRGVEYVVTMTCEDDCELVVDVEDRVTGDQWHGSFTESYIEDLTRKTGNYKQFSIFVNMLESALTQISDTVSLDLLTYADLESLRSRKSGTGPKVNAGTRSAILNTKRYLILTYTVEFDRIHYPLPLPYQGKPDPKTLQNTIRQLRQEIKSLKSTGTKDSRHKEIERLKRDYEKLLQEKEDLEAEFLEFKREVANTTKGSAAKEVRILKSIVKNLEEELVQEKTKYQRANTKRGKEHRELLDELEDLKASERNLRVRVKSLTNELAVYRRRPGTSHNTSTNSRKSHTSYNSSYMRNGGGGGSSRENSLTRNYRGGSSRENSLNRNYRGGTSRDNSLNKNKRDKNTTRNSWDSSRLSRFSDRSNRDRSTSRDRSLTNRNKPDSRNRPGSRPGSRDNSLSRNGYSSRESLYSRDRSRSTTVKKERAPPRSRTPSPAYSVLNSMSKIHHCRNNNHYSARMPRFDPTAYIKEQQRLKKEANLKQNRDVKRRQAGIDKKPKPSPRSTDRSYGSRRPASRSSSVGSLRSRTSSLESLSDIGSEVSRGSKNRYGRINKDTKRTSTAWSSPDVSLSEPKPKGNKILASTPERNRTRSRLSNKENIPEPKDDSKYFDRSEEMTEIDARLNRLQQFIKTTMQ